MNVATFRQNFPEFTDTTAYPGSQITFWAGLAEQMLPEDIWGDVWETACQLYVAHEITISRQSKVQANIGGTPGMNGGAPQSKTVGQVSVTYDTNTTTEKDAGFWNLTVYGKQLYRLIKVFGAGCIQL